MYEFLSIFKIVNFCASKQARMSENGPCVGCGAPTSDHQKCPGCKKYVFLHCFCGYNDGKEIWCLPCANRAPPKSSYATVATTVPQTRMCITPNCGRGYWCRLIVQIGALDVNINRCLTCVHLLFTCRHRIHTITQVASCNMPIQRLPSPPLLSNTF